MRIFRHHKDVPDAFKGAVVAVGNFDGVHRGHQALIGEAQAHGGRARRAAGRARLRAASAGILPSLAGIVPPDAVPRQGAADRRSSGADILYALAFDAEMAAKRAAQEFVMDVLVEGLGIGAVVVGIDFQFGKARAGNATLLSYMGEMEGFGVTLFDPVLAQGDEKISSTEIRDALKAGRPDEAARLLGHYWSVEARVEHGDKRGRTIGFPTANMKLDDCLKPAFGIYAVRAKIIEERPSSDSRRRRQFRHPPDVRSRHAAAGNVSFDFDGDLYGKHMAVELIAFLRPEAKLDDLEALKAQIAKDSDAAKESPCDKFEIISTSPA